MKTLIILMFGIFLTQQIQAQEIIQVPDDSDVLYISSGVEVAIDQEGLLTIEDVASGALKFKQTLLPYSGGLTRSIHWFRFTLQNTEFSNNKRLLIAEPNYVDKLELYSPTRSGDSRYTMMVSGDSIVVNERPIPSIHGFHAFEIILENNKPTTFYLKMQTHDVSVLSLTISTLERFSSPLSSNMFLSGLVLGALILISIRAFSMWLWLRQPIYLYIIGYGFGAILHQIVLSGLILDFLLPESPNIITMIDPISACLQSIFFIKFVTEFFESKHHFPRLHYLLSLLFYFSIVTIISIPFDYFVDLSPYLFIFAIILLPALLYITWKAQKLGVMGSKSVFWGACIYVPLILSNLFGSIGIIPLYPIIMNAPAFASLVLLFSMQQSMYRQVNQFEVEKIAAEIAANEANKKAEEEKQRRAEQSTFMTMVAHEIHTPLAVIDSAIQTIGRNNPNLAPFISDRHTRIQNSVSLLNQLLENTLAAESNDSRPLQPKIEQINAEEFVSFHTKNSLSNEKNYTLDIESDSIITADPKLLKHIISNLLVNAEKYSPKETPIFITVEKQERNTQLGIVISVKNNHFSETPIEPSNWLKKYFRQTETPNINGFGLGLYLVNKIIDAHQGDISIDIQPTASRFNWLVTITVWLPSIRIEDHI